MASDGDMCMARIWKQDAAPYWHYVHRSPESSPDIDVGVAGHDRVDSDRVQQDVVPRGSRGPHQPEAAIHLLE